MVHVYKICTAVEWREATRIGHYAGSAADVADGFIHLSAAAQVAGTAARHFGGQAGLVIVEFAAENLAGLKWEPSRAGALFPHVYGVLPVDAALRMAPLPFVAGQHLLPWKLPRELPGELPQ